MTKFHAPFNNLNYTNLHINGRDAPWHVSTAMCYFLMIFVI